jgi:hypothetical protein
MCIVALVVAQGDSLHSAASNIDETLYPALNTMATYRQVVDEIRDAPKSVTYVKIKQQEQRLLANVAASEERLNGRF